MDSMIGLILYRLPIRRVRVRNEHINGIMDFEVNHSRVTGNSEVAQMLQTAAFARYPLGRDSPNNPPLATPSATT